MHRRNRLHLAAEPVNIQLTNNGSGSVVSWTVDLGAVTCIDASLQNTSTMNHEDHEIPALGEAFFYLVA